ncbi:hypothetical protein ENBRE01_0898 [Enteropsectra breve]|nr:hypothetical protein ENBRE01_0898 [Enteropsectra breve]
MDVALLDLHEKHWNAALNALKEYPLREQMAQLDGLKIGILDYCGISHRYHRLFWKYGCDIYILEDINEDVDEMIEKYEIIYIMMDCGQRSFISLKSFDIPHIGLEFYRGRMYKAEKNADENQLKTRKKALSIKI